MSDRVQAFHAKFSIIGPREAQHRLSKGEEVWSCGYAADTLEDEDGEPSFTKEFNEIGPFSADSSTKYYEYKVRYEACYGNHITFVEVQLFSDVDPQSEKAKSSPRYFALELLEAAVALHMSYTGASKPDNYWLDDWFEAI
jgi:hypothetical protein